MVQVMVQMPGSGPPNDFYISKSGSIGLTAVDAQHVVGSFTTGMARQDGGEPNSLTGTFDAPVLTCP